MCQIKIKISFVFLFWKKIVKQQKSAAFIRIKGRVEVGLPCIILKVHLKALFHLLFPRTKERLFKKIYFYILRILKYVHFIKELSHFLQARINIPALINSRIV